MVIKKDRSEGETASSEKELARLAQQVPVALFRSNLEGHLIYANAEWHRLSGLRIDEFADGGWTAAIHPQDRELVRQEWFQAARDGRAFSHEFRLLTPSEEIRWVHFRAVPLLDSHGTRIGHAGSVEDVTDRLRAEIALRKMHDELEEPVQERTEKLAQSNEILSRQIAERHRAESELRKSDERFRMVVRATNDAVWDWDLVQGELWWSEGFHNIFGHQPADNKPEAWVSRVHPEDRDRVVQGIRTLIASGGEFWSEEYRFLKRDGDYACVFDRGYVLRDADGKAVRMIGAMMDITSRRKAENEAKNLNAELENRVADRTSQLEIANKELESFSYSVSHDLRAPLRAIEGFARVLQEDYSIQLGSEGRRFLDIITSSSRQMALLIDDLLTLSRLGRQELKRHPVDMTDLVSRVWNDSQSSLRVPVDFRLEKLPGTTGDEALLRQVWMNLIENAIKFSSGKTAPVIQVSGRRESQFTVYSIADNGAGFDGKYAEKLFGVFQRLHSKEDFEGTGVGLAIVHRLVHRHGGNAWAEGRVNEGATFFFNLPS